MNVVGGPGPMVVVHNFSYGLLTPALGYVMSCLGCFLGLRCTTRAREVQGSSRVRWLLLAGVSIGVAGIWGMHFIAMLGYSIPGQAIRYSVPVTILSMVIAVVVVSVGLLIVGFGGDGLGPLLTGGLPLARSRTMCGGWRRWPSGPGTRCVTCRRRSRRSPSVRRRSTRSSR